MGQLTGMCVLAEFLNPSYSHKLGRICFNSKCLCDVGILSVVCELFISHLLGAPGHSNKAVLDVGIITIIICASLTKRGREQRPSVRWEAGECDTHGAPRPPLTPDGLHQARLHLVGGRGPAHEVRPPHRPRCTRLTGAQVSGAQPTLAVNFPEPVGSWSAAAPARSSVDNKMVSMTFSSTSSAVLSTGDIS